jgi:hypothetical protein
VNLRVQQIVASVELVEAVGGGWNSSTLPTPQQIISRDTLSSALVAEISCEIPCCPLVEQDNVASSQKNLLRSLARKVLA